MDVADGRVDVEAKAKFLDSKIKHYVGYLLDKFQVTRDAILPKLNGEHANEMINPIHLLLKRVSSSEELKEDDDTLFPLPSAFDEAEAHEASGVDSCQGEYGDILAA